LKTKKVLISKSADSDIHEIVLFIRRDNPNAATGFKKNLLKKLASLSRLSARGRVLPEFKGSTLQRYRELIFGNYRIIYRELEKEVRVLRIMHARRMLVGVRHKRG